LHRLVQGDGRGLGWRCSWDREGWVRDFHKVSAFSCQPSCKVSGAIYDATGNQEPLRAGLLSISIVPETGEDGQWST
jgi:hypothetical protein